MKPCVVLHQNPSLPIAKGRELPLFFKEGRREILSEMFILILRILRLPYTQSKELSNFGGMNTTDRRKIAKTGQMEYR